jgi:methyl-accepting chemotaxis protein
MAMRRTGDATAVQKAIAGDNRELSDSIRSLLAEMDKEERTLAISRQVAADTSASSAEALIRIGSVVSVFVLLVAAYYISRGVTVPVRASIATLLAASTELNAASEEHQRTTSEQSAAVNETTATAAELSASQKQVIQTAASVAEVGHKAAAAVGDGQQAVDLTLRGLTDIRSKTQATTQRIVALSDRSQQVGKIVGAIKDLAGQTNMLALNAAIEAARAGEHGKGFSVVASEVKVLAEQSKKATAQVRQILGDIQKATNGAVMAAENGTKSVGAAIKVVNQSGDTIRTLSDAIGDAVQAATQISASAGQQATGMAQINQAMRNISDVTAQNVASVRQAERAAQDLNTLGTTLKELVAGYAF